jgi:hypothetical protein
MNILRPLMQAHRRKMLALVLAALGMIGVLPAGTMIAPAGAQGGGVILCPQTHPLARALAARSADAQDGGEPAAQMAALHAALGHGPASPSAHDSGHHAGHEADHHGGDHGAPLPAVDHAAMGHHAPAPADPAPDPQSTAAPAQSCAFAGLALAALLSERSEAPSALLAPLPEPPSFLERLRLVAPAHLRPPLRAPPALI